MTAPSATVRKLNANAAQAGASDLGILCIIAPALAGVLNTPQSFVDTSVIQSTCSEGPLCEYGTYFVDASQNQCVLVRAATSIPATYANPGVTASTPMNVEAASDDAAAVITTGITPATAPVVTGNAAIVSGDFGGSSTLDGLTLILNVDGAGPLTLTLSKTTNALTQAAFLAAVATQWPKLTATVSSTFLVLTDSTVGTAGSIVVGAGTANTILGLTAGTTTGTDTPAAHGLTTGDVVTIAGSTGDTAINGTWPVTVLSPTTFSIPVAGSGAYDGGGTVVALGTNYVGTGTCVPTVGSAAAIADDYQPVIMVVTGGTLGTAGIVLQAYLDGVTPSAPVALGTALTFTPLVPVTGVSSGVVVNFTTAQTLFAGDVISLPCVTGPRMSTSDLTAALAALQRSQLGWDLLLVHGETSPAFVSLIDTWITSLSARNQFPHALLNTRHEYFPRPAGESDPNFQTAIAPLLANSASINASVGSSGGDLTSLVSGLVKVMPQSLYNATRLEMSDIGVDPARVSDGALVGNPNLYLANGFPKWHDENADPGLDSLTTRLGTLRTFSDRQGTYITDSYILSSSGSNFVYTQHARVINAACKAIQTAMTTLLSSGYARDRVTGLITKAQALDWQARGQDILDDTLGSQVSGAVFSVSQTDINLGNGPATITCYVYVEALGYVKKFVIGAGFVNVLPAAQAA